MKAQWIQIYYSYNDNFIIKANKFTKKEHNLLNRHQIQKVNLMEIIGYDEVEDGFIQIDNMKLKIFN